jgi:hypothetical protein
MVGWQWKNGSTLLARSLALGFSILIKRTPQSGKSSVVIIQQITAICQLIATFEE